MTKYDGFVDKKHEFDFFSRILRVWMAANKKSGKEMSSYLKDFYNFEKSSIQKMSQFLGYPKYTSIKAKESQMRTFIEKEREGILSLMYSPQEFGSSNKIMYESMDVMSKSITKKNTFLNITGVINNFTEWGTPVMQMHFSFLNRIAVEIGLLNDSDFYGKKIQNQTFFLPYTKSEFDVRLDTDADFKERFIFFRKINELNMVNVDFVFIDSFFNLIMNNYDFFNDKSNLTYLGFPSKLNLHLRKCFKNKRITESNKGKIYLLLKEYLLLQIYNKDSLSSLNYLYVSNVNGGANELWAYLYNNKNGLNYQFIGESNTNSSNIKQVNLYESKLYFSNILMRA